MNDKTTISEPQDKSEERVPCPVQGCEGLPFDHQDADSSKNLHRMTGPELEGVLMSIDYVMMPVTRGRWVLDIETYHSETETPPIAASLMAFYLAAAAVRGVEMNNALIAGVQK